MQQRYSTKYLAAGFTGGFHASSICIFMLLTFLLNHMKSDPSALGAPPDCVALTGSAYAYPIFTPFFGESTLQTSDVPAGGALLWVHTFFAPDNDYTVCIKRLKAHRPGCAARPFNAAIISKSSSNYNR
jgi:hypothetical protein